MRHSYRFAHVLELCDMVSFTVRHVDQCDHRCDGCWRLSGMSSGNPFGDLVSAYIGPYEHLALTEALDVLATVAAWQSSALEAADAVRSRKWEQLALESVLEL